MFSITFWVLCDKFLAFPPGPGGFREIREAYRIHFHLSWYLKVPVVTSYSQKASWGDFCLFRVRYVLKRPYTASYSPYKSPI